MASKSHGSLGGEEVETSWSSKTTSRPSLTASTSHGRGTNTDYNKGERADIMAMKPEERHDIELARGYSAFTVPQKRAIILSGSFIGLLSYMSSSIFYPAVNQVHLVFLSQTHY